MRTTLTLDDDLATRLKDKELTRASGRSFKEITNQVLRRGLSAGELPTDQPEPFVVLPKACGFEPGVNPLKLNQLYDDLETERFGTGGGYGIHEPRSSPT